MFTRKPSQGGDAVETPGSEPSMSRSPAHPGGADAGGTTITVTGRLVAKEDLTVDGQIDGAIELPDHVLTIGSHARITAEILARVVIVQGHVSGKILATERVELHSPDASVEGDILAPKVTIADGAFFKGFLDMTSSPAREKVAATQQDTATAKAAPKTPPVEESSADKTVTRPAASATRQPQAGRNAPSVSPAPAGA